MNLTTTILGAGATLASTVAFVPQIVKIWQTGGKDVSIAMLTFYVAGVTLWLSYGITIHAVALSVANGASILFAGCCLILKLYFDRCKPIVHESKRLRIAIDMDETIADSLKEQIRRYNAEFAESITLNDLIGTTVERIAPPERLAAVRGTVRNAAFF